MTKSMTGFGRGECTRDGRRFKVELKSVNHRFSDFSIKLPRFMNPFEGRIRARLAQTIVRGKVDVWISFESYTQEDVTISVNEPFADAYVAAYRRLASRYTDGHMPSLFDILAKTPDIIILDSYESALSTGEAQEQIWAGLSAALDEALALYDAMRTAEGSALKSDLHEKRSYALLLLSQIRASASAVVDTAAARLRDRLSELITKMGEANPDDSRILTEIAILADKHDINEEITRLESHMTQLDEMLNGSTAAGRKMDFLVQEMNREANTIGSKSADAALTKLVVELKSQIEKIREQVQNIE